MVRFNRDRHVGMVIEQFVVGGGQINRRRANPQLLEAFLRVIELRKERLNLDVGVVFRKPCSHTRNSREENVDLKCRQINESRPSEQQYREK